MLKEDLLLLLEKDAGYTPEELAAMLSATREEIVGSIRELEESGVILGRKAIINWEKTKREYVTAYIEVKVTPKREQGFDEIAKEIMGFPEVSSVYLMSGGFDLSVVITGNSFKDVALFVSRKLALLDSVVSTATNFVLCRYKDGGVSFVGGETDERRHMFS